MGPQWPGQWAPAARIPGVAPGRSGHAPAPTERPWGGCSKTDQGEGQGSVFALGT